MACIDIKKPDILVLEFWQEKGDQDYGSCIWARFYLDMENYHLSIESDCGNYGHGWIPTPQSESFLKLLSRMDKSYFLSKISCQNVVDTENTFEAVKEILGDEAEYKGIYLEEADIYMDDIYTACTCKTEGEVYEAVTYELRGTALDGIDHSYLYDCIKMDYPYNAQKIANIFTKFVQPKIKELLEVSE